ncbi:MAG: hypothetical protein HS119_11225 [Flavobacteriales bacterium]|nr:hypothetical protein [Flavobacteriales bacterium]
MKLKNKLSPIPNLNKEIHYMGLSPGYWLTLCVALLVLFVILRAYIVLMLPILFYSATKLEKLQKSGNPNFIQSMLNWNKMKKSFCDTRKLFDYL